MRGYENLAIVTRPTADGSFEVLTGEKQRGSFAGKTVFPGGKMELSETVDAAVRREVAEETGVALGTVHRLGWLSINDKRYGDWHKPVFLFGAQVAENTEAVSTSELVNTWRRIDDPLLTDNMPQDVPVWWDIVRDALPDPGWNQVAVHIQHEVDGASRVVVRYPDFAEQPNRILRDVVFPSVD